MDSNLFDISKRCSPLGSVITISQLHPSIVWGNSNSPFRSLNDIVFPLHLITGWPLLSLIVKSSYSLVNDSDT